VTSSEGGRKPLTVPTDRALARVGARSRLWRRWDGPIDGQRGDGEEIAGDDRLAVIGEEGRPAAGGIAAAWHASQIPGDAAFGDVEAELQEFPVDPGRPPVRILRRQLTDQGPHLLADPRPAPALSGSPAPVEAKAGSMPPDHGFNRRPRPLAFEHGDLLSEREDLECGIAATADEHAKCCQD
jgi:hypothetical protein